MRRGAADVGCGGMKERKKEQQFLPHKRGGDGRGASMMQHVANIYPTLATAAKKRLKKLHSKILREGVIVIAFTSVSV